LKNSSKARLYESIADNMFQ